MELSDHFDIPVYNCIEILKHFVNTKAVCGSFVGTERFVALDEIDLRKVASLVKERGTISSLDVLSLFPQECD